MSDVKRSLVERARASGKTVVFPESEDERVIRAAYQLAEQGPVRPIVIAEPETFEAQRRHLGFPEPDFALVDPRTDQESYVELLLELRRHKGLTHQQAKQTCADPLYRAALMVAKDQVDCCVAGCQRTTGDTVRAAIQCIGAKFGSVSSFFLMLLDEQTLLYADCGVIPHPNAEQLAGITRASAASWQQLMARPAAIAMLSFSSKGSASDPSIDIINEAMRLALAAEPDLNIDGELQADAALIPEIADRKAPGSPVAGKADVLIFPNLHAGNIAYKLTERLAGATALGPILQGLNKPMNDLSRGCSVQDIVLVSAISAIQALSVGAQ